LTISPRTFRPAPSGPSARPARASRSARVGFRLSVAGRVRFSVERRAGRRYVRVAGSFTRTAKAGANAFRLTGRAGGRALRPARYRLVATPSAGGRTGRTVRADFLITR
jgi:hypothetical protein